MYVETKRHSWCYERFYYFYFVHSYHLRPNDLEVVLGETEYGYPFASAVRNDNVWGVQFHPEKSQQAGLQLLQNFCTLT